ncbi:MAG: 6-hydroxymethylpterin diphosphokinase MptE-like protein [Oscillospiraceae bacterium]
MSEIKFVIWGCGFRGKNLCRIIPYGMVQAFIDSSADNIGKECCGIPVISFEQYMQFYRKCIIIVSPYWSHNEIAALLEKENIPYLRTDILPQEICEAPVDNFLQIAANMLENEESIYLYGITLFSILLQIKLKENGRTSVLIPQNGCSDTLLFAVKEYCTVSPDKDENISKMYLTYKPSVSETLPKHKIINFSDFSKTIPEYKNNELERFRNAFSKRRCFIVGTGPSLRMDDLEKLHKNKELCISSNGIFKAYKNTSWRPDFYLLEDKDGFQNWKDSLQNEGKTDNMLIADCCLNERKSTAPFTFFHINKELVNSEYIPKFSDDLTFGTYWSSTITYSCIQLAFFLGCTEIYLLGIDFNYSGKYNHFTMDYHPVEESGDNDQTRQLITMYQGYIRAVQKAREKNIILKNASRKTMLDVIERVDFDNLME